MWGKSANLKQSHQSAARLGRPHQTWWGPTTHSWDHSSFGAWWDTETFETIYTGSFGCRTANNSVFGSRGGFFWLNPSDEDIATVRTAVCGWLSSWAWSHILVSLWLPYVIGRPLYFRHVVSSSFILLLSFFHAYSHSQPSEIGCLPYFHTWCVLSANLECRSEICCLQLTENTGCKEFAIWAPSYNFVRLYLRN